MTVFHVANMRDLIAEETALDQKKHGLEDLTDRLRQSADRVFAVRLTSKAHDGDRDFLPIGSGAWDSQGRPSWVDIEQLYSVHREGMRREASAIDVKRFAVVAQALQRRYGWQAGE